MLPHGIWQVKQNFYNSRTLMMEYCQHNQMSVKHSVYTGFLDYSVKTRTGCIPCKVKICTHIHNADSHEMLIHNCRAAQMGECIAFTTLCPFMVYDRCICSTHVDSWSMRW